MTKRCPILLTLSVLFLLAGSRLVLAQATGEFRCNGGTKDGQACEDDNGCITGGVCVIAQPICVGGDDDTQLCDCASGTCPITATCSDPSTSVGACNGGITPGGDCSCSCAGGVPCIGTQKVCLTGALKGFSCVNDSQCSGALCRSTAKVCVGGDFDSFACVDGADCTGTAPVPNGVCQGPEPGPTDTPTRTPTRTATRGTVTPTSTQATPTGVTQTPTRTPTVSATSGTPATPPTLTATVTPITPIISVTPTSVTNTATPLVTRTPAPGTAILAANLSATDTSIALDSAKSFPQSGRVQIDSEIISYGAKSGNLLTAVRRASICSEAATHKAGALVVDISGRPISCQALAEGGGCSLMTEGSRGRAWPIAVIGGVLGWIVRRRSG